MAEDMFDISGPSGYQHTCFVFTPAACTIWEILKCHEDQNVNLDFVKSTLLCAIRALDVLHSDAHLIHTDVKLDNILVYSSDFSLVKLCDFGAVKSVGDIVIKIPSIGTIIAGMMWVIFHGKCW